MKSYLLVIVIFFATAEMGARAWTFFFGSPADQALFVLHPEPKLGWKARPNLHTVFYRAALNTDENGNRIIPDSSAAKMQLRTYGPSSAFGWGVESAETYTALVAHLLPITTKNFSQIGFSSEQGKLLLDQDPPQHAVLIFAYGINDLDRFRFYFPSASPDSEFFHHPVPRAEFLMSELSTYWHSFRYLNRFAALLRGRMDCRFPKEMPRRVSNEEFLKNIGVFAQAAKQSQSQLIAIDTPYWPAELNSAPKNDSNYSQVLAASARGDCSEARALFQTFLGTETDRIIQDQRKLNSALASWAKENKVPLVQASQLLATQEDFVDPIHPSVLGHAKIAAEIAKLIVHKE